eukprot:5720986-Pleurochrysis_carterae.AAC.1
MIPPRRFEECTHDNAATNSDEVNRARQPSADLGGGVPLLIAACEAVPERRLLPRLQIRGAPVRLRQRARRARARVHAHAAATVR